MSGDGYTRFPNKLIEQIMSYGFNATQMAILLYIARNTYGWNSSFCDIPISRVARETGKHKNGIAREIERLIADNVLYVENEPTYRKPRTVSINTDFDSWSHSIVVESQQGVTVTPKCAKRVTAECDSESQSSVIGESQQSVTIKERIKENIKKELKKEPAAPSFEEEEEYIDLWNED